MNWVRKYFPKLEHETTSHGQDYCPMTPNMMPKLELASALMFGIIQDMGI